MEILAKGQQSLVRRIVRQLIFDESLMDDAVDEVFLHFFENAAHKFKPCEESRPFFKTVVANKCRDIARSQVRRRRGRSLEHVEDEVLACFADPPNICDGMLVDWVEQLLFCKFLFC